MTCLKNNFLNLNDVNIKEQNSLIESIDQENNKIISYKKELKLPDNIKILNSPDELLNFLTDIKENLKYKNTIKSFSQKQPINNGF